MALEYENQLQIFDDMYLPNSWENLKSVPMSNHDSIFVDILKKHGYNQILSPIPLKARYSKGRKWSISEFELCYKAWKSGTSITLISAALNRNPQDIIYKLLARCKSENILYSQKGHSEGFKAWTPNVANCAAELFDAGLPAWRIAVLFRVDHENVEKALFSGRSDYGHNKKNPFTICTAHKHLLNKKVLQTADIPMNSILDSFAGEGYLAKVIEKLYPIAKVYCIENDVKTFIKSQEYKWSVNTKWINDNNLKVMNDLAIKKLKFDIIDLDPFVTCHEQIPLVWSLLNFESLLFLTFGGEYRRSFIKSNRIAISKRYGFYSNDLDNQKYLEILPSYFLGWVANQAMNNGFQFSILRAVRYPNICRFWLRVTKSSQILVENWYKSNIKFNNGFYWKNLSIPRFNDIRNEIKEETEDFTNGSYDNLSICI